MTCIVIGIAVFHYLHFSFILFFRSFHSISKIRDEDYRQIQTNVPFLAPEILAVFANSQIFHDHQPSKSLAIVHKSPSINDGKQNIIDREAEVEKKLLQRLEGNNRMIILYIILRDQLTFR